MTDHAVNHAECAVTDVRPFRIIDPSYEILMDLDEQSVEYGITLCGCVRMLQNG